MAESGDVGLFPPHLQDQSFVLGFEAGMIWQRLEAGERAFGVTVRVDNEELCRRMARARGLFCEILAIPGADGWAVATFAETPHPPSARPALTVIPGGRT